MKKNKTFSSKEKRFMPVGKFLKIMKVLTLIMFVCIVHVSARSYSQITKLSMNMQNVSIKQVLSKIEDLSEFRFLYSDSKINVEKIVDVDCNNELIEDILRNMFEGSDILFKVVGKQILLSNSAESVENTQQQKSVSGKVSDSSGATLPGVSVVVKGTTTGIITDNNGNYSLTNIPENAILQFSFVGMKTQMVAVGGKTTINIMLAEESIGIEEVVAVGYGTMKKSDLTGAVISANIEAFRESPNVNIMQSLQGSVAGVQIGQTNQAGAEPSINIRGGENTLNGNTSPLIVLDGIIYGGRLSDLNPADVKSVDILKDASSKAIYGAQAANGVIIITTKEGKTNGKSTITYSVSVSTQMPTIDVRLFNREEVLQRVKDIEYKKAYLAPDYIQENPDWDYSQSELLINHMRGIENGTDHDWWGEATSPGYIINHSLNLSGGTQNTSYYISGGYTDHKGFIINDKYKRSSVRINLQSKVTDWFTLGVNTFGAFADYSGVCPSMSGLANTSPLVDSKDENGDYIINHLGNNLTNPILSTLADDKDLRNNISGNFYAILSIPKINGLKYRINYSNNLRWDNHAYSNKYDNSQTGGAYKTNSSTYDMTLDNIITYEKQLNTNHGIQLTFVAGLNKVQYEYMKAIGINYWDLSLSYNSLQQAVTQNISSSAWKESSTYQMARVNYNYKNKYLLTSTIRRDGFSGFAKNNKFGFFPSVGLGWIVSEEGFFNVPQINYLKIRTSYGVNGNKTTRYSSLATVEATTNSKYVFGDGSPTSIGQSVKSLGNNDLAWEKITGFNGGIDFGIFNNRIRGNVEYYNTTTTDLLWDMSLPQMTGFQNITTNLGEIANSGFEFAISVTPVKTNDFKWDMDINFSKNSNKIKKLLGTDDNGDGKEDDLVASGLFIGKSIGAIYNYETDGIWQLTDQIPTGYYPGAYRIVDQNGDGIFSATYDRIFLGKKEPAYQFGIQNTFSYRNFTLRFFINSIQGGKDGYLSANNVSANSTGNSENQNWFKLFEYWSPSNPDAKYRAPWVTPAISPTQCQDRSFVRLQDISLSYKLKPYLLRKVGFSDAKIYISGKNLLTLTNWDGWDPETGQGISLTYPENPFPVMKSYSLGIDLSF